ncbi:MAG: 16S rRNA (cytosine(1402)-N(4))-methyltransferase RsmH [Methylococcales bacterium]|jgi:16S rRNA (cytosine1402-N4)-methyltransferase|nr:16S rRNA (cytosine(1402)-N(4))-methyltransferase RsmH [Methylococcaceae bacterium]HIL40754.1 16S rRNA (cytosine(1402)-N(4))-methyltransferase RsmH [Methylococcales bacterium]
MDGHLPVMLKECIQGLNIKKDGKYLDCTFGRGGHSKHILAELGEKGSLLALDRDPMAIASDNAKQLLLDRRFRLQHQSFSLLGESVSSQGWDGQVDGILLDLGVSSPQLDDSSRGFSFMRDGPLDMRMDTSSGVSAAQWLASVDEYTLISVLRHYGEERFARRIAVAVLKERDIEPLQTTQQLVRLIETAIPVREKHKHPATRSFQAIRIEINQELEQLKQALQQSINVLSPGGILVVMSFHSLEDRIVKRFIRDQSRGKYTPLSRRLLENDGSQITFKKVGKAIKASEDEVKQNPRSRSAVLRLAERLG